MRQPLVLGVGVLAALGTLAPRVAALPPRYFAMSPAYGNSAYAAMAHENALRLAAWQNALRLAALPRLGGSNVNLNGLPPGLYSLALRRAANDRAAALSWNRQMAVFQRMALNRLTGGGSSDGDGPAPSGD